MMECAWSSKPKKRGYRCSQCGFYAPTRSCRRVCGPSPKASGPGRELTKLLVELIGVEKCWACTARAMQMNVWGVEGCREHRDEIIGWLREAADKAGWKSPLPSFDPIPDLVDEAIRRAE